MKIRFTPARRITPPGWDTMAVAACTPRVRLVHNVCGELSRDTWEFDDDETGRQTRADRRRMRHIAHTHASAHRCPTPAEIAAEDAACAEATEWLDKLTTCPNCGADGSPSSQYPGKHQCHACRYSYDLSEAIL